MGTAVSCVCEFVFLSVCVFALKISRRKALKSNAKAGKGVVSGEPGVGLYVDTAAHFFCSC